jgi:polysaccharide biosynthesis/export protein
VRLEGEVTAAGVYEVQPGETLPQLLARAGGLTPQAYLYASEFTRESTRKAQQQRLDEFSERLERDVERQGSVRSQNVVSPEDAVGISQRLDAQRRLVQKLKGVRANGRVILGLKSWDGEVAKLPEIVLEDGDRFFVPERPATINIVGAVYNPSALLFAPDRSLSSYLRKAGGGTRDSDRGHLFIVRPDGSILSKSGRASWFAGGLEGAKLLPGDTVVVPEKLSRTSILKGLKDWSQVFGQLALGAAALQTLTTR